MSQFSLYIAASLDGFIARPDGSLDWLTELPNPDQSDYGYSAFLEGIDSVIMGRATYEEILGFGVEWPYADCQSWVVSRQEKLDLPTPKTHLLPDLSPASLAGVSESSTKGVWVIGGGQVISTLLQADTIDRLILSYAPVLLGEGIPLVAAPGKETRFRLIESQTFASGIISLTYEKA